MTILYPELYDIIIAFLHDDPASLRVSTHVCRAWLPAARRLLFHSVHLYTGEQCQRVFAILLSSPHTASYVHTLFIVQTESEWIGSEVTFIQLLRKLAYLRVIEFSFPRKTGSASRDPVATSRFVAEVSAAISAMPLHSATFRRLSFSSLPNFVRIINACCHLSTLQIDQADITSVMHAPASAIDVSLELFHSSYSITRNKSPLQNLLLRSISSSIIIPILLHPESSVDPTTLVRLVMNITPHSYGNTLVLLKSTPCLESLELEIDPELDYDAHLTPHSIINLSLLPSLLSLSLQTSLLLARIDPLPWLLATLSTASPSSTILEHLSLTCILDKPPPSLTVQAFDRVLLRWRHLDDLLTQPTFASMWRFRLDFALDNPIGDETGAFISQEFIQQLQALSGRGVLEVDVYEIR